MLSRLDRSPVANWWWTVDRWFLAAFLSLMGLGIVLSFAASPAVAERIGLDSFHFATRQIVYMVPALIALIAVSFLDARQIRRLSLSMLGLMLVMMVAVLFVGVEVKGAHRWLSLFGISVQPSEFLKPAFVIICAWLFAEHKRQPDIPGNLFAMILLGVVLALLVAQPDLGQTILILGTWGVMFFMAGMPWLWIIVIGGLGAAGAVGAYTVFPHVAGRIDRFLTGEGDTFQVDMGRDAVIQGGWFGSVRARAPSSASSPTATPTSSFRSPARNSASCSACSSWRSSPSSFFAALPPRSRRRTTSRASPSRAWSSSSASSRSSTWASTCNSCLPRA